MACVAAIFEDKSIYINNQNLSDVFHAWAVFNNCLLTFFFHFCERFWLNNLKKLHSNVYCGLHIIFIGAYVSLKLLPKTAIKWPIFIAKKDMLCVLFFCIMWLLHRKAVGFCLFSNDTQNLNIIFDLISWGLNWGEHKDKDKMKGQAFLKLICTWVFLVQFFLIDLKKLSGSFNSLFGP
jgi:hypothetical protein